MTMNTRVHIAKPIHAEKLFLHVLGILESDPTFQPAWEKPDPSNPFSAAAPGPLRLGKATYSHVRKGEPFTKPDGTPRMIGTPPEPWIHSESSYGTTLGQGLGAIWCVDYGDDGPLVWPPYEWDEEGDEPNTDPMRTHFVSADFDTAYGYETANGSHCSDLHAFLLSVIGAHLQEVGADDWVWRHEEKGTWHRADEIHLRGNAPLAAAHFGITMT